MLFNATSMFHEQIDQHHCGYEKLFELIELLKWAFANCTARWKAGYVV